MDIDLKFHSLAPPESPPADLSLNRNLPIVLRKKSREKGVGMTGLLKGLFKGAVERELLLMRSFELILGILQ